MVTKQRLTESHDPDFIDCLEHAGAIETALAGKFYVFGARTNSAYDPIPSAWQGVEVYEVDYYCEEPAFGGGICPGIYRDHTQEPPSPTDPGAGDS